METTPDRALIFSIIQGGVGAYQVAKTLGIKAEYLLDKEDRRIWESCEEIFLPKGRMPNYADIRQNLRIDLPESTLVFDVELCTKDILRRALTTRLTDELGPIEQMIPVDPFVARDRLGDLVRATNWVQGTVVSTGMPSTAEDVKKAYLEAQNRAGGLLGFSSPWPSRDKNTLGFRPNEVTVILAKRKTGKSWMLLKLAQHIWTAKLPTGESELKPGENILVISMEMPVNQVLQRFYAIHKKLDYQKFRAGRLDPLDEVRFFDFVEEMKKPDPTRSNIIFASSDKVRNVADIIGLTAQYRPKAVLIDSFYILDAPDKRAQMWERMIMVIKGIKFDLAVKFGIPVITTTQLSGQVKRGDLNAEADAVSYAKAIGDYADAIDGLFGNDKFRDSNRRILRGMEGRDFVTVDLEINFNPTTHDYSEIRVLDKVEDGDGKALDDTGDDSGGGPGYSEDEITID